MDEIANNKLRRLGRTDIKITPVGLGGNQFSGNRGVMGMMTPDLSQDEINAIIQAALEGGINWFDTAEIYGSGHSERALSSALQAAGAQDDEVIITTKWFPLLRNANNIRRSISDRLKCLADYTIDLYLVHFPYSTSSREVEMDAMADLVDAGKIRTVGVSNFNARQMRCAHAALAKRGLPLAANQVKYSLLHREIEGNGVLETAKELGITIIAYTPLESGVLSGKYHRDPELLEQKSYLRKMRLRGTIERCRALIDTLEQIAAVYDATPAQVAVNWLVNFHGETIVAIPGASKVQHARQAAGAMQFVLSETEMAQLDEISRQYCFIS